MKVAGMILDVEDGVICVKIRHLKHSIGIVLSFGYLCLLADCFISASFCYLSRDPFTHYPFPISKISPMQDMELNKVQDYPLLFLWSFSRDHICEHCQSLSSSLILLQNDNMLLMSYFASVQLINVNMPRTYVMMKMALCVGELLFKAPFLLFRLSFCILLLCNDGFCAGSFHLVSDLLHIPFPAIPRVLPATLSDS